MKRYRVEPGSKVNLKRYDPTDTAEFSGSKDEAAPLLAELNSRLEALQEKLWAEGSHKVLIVLQGMDTSGKDGVIRHVFDGVNPIGVRVASFKVPSEEERGHDFLWRVHAQAPGAGEMVIFNRSHYEDVLVVRVKNLAPDGVWKNRYGQINDFERLLAESGTTILKFFLHVSKDEQKKRLEERIKDPAKRWKFRLGDLDDRKLWGQYQEAYEAALEKTSTELAPWYVVPADRKWYRNLVIATVLVEALEKLDLKSPKSPENLDGVVVE